MLYLFTDMLRGIIQYIVIKYSSTSMLVLTMFKIHTTNTTCIKSCFVLYVKTRMLSYKLSKYSVRIFIVMQNNFGEILSEYKTMHVMHQRTYEFEKFNSKTTESGEVWISEVLEEHILGKVLYIQSSSSIEHRESVYMLYRLSSSTTNISNITNNLCITIHLFILYIIPCLTEFALRRKSNIFFKFIIFSIVFLI